MGNSYTAASAVLSDDGMHRYSLTREWGEHGRRILFCMLNPSTADGTQDDPTIRKCVAYAKAWGYDALTVVNQFSLRATDPKVLLGKGDSSLRGQQWSWTFCREVERADSVVAAWGRLHPSLRRFSVEESPWFWRFAWRALRLNKDGSPAHPLYLPGKLCPMSFDGSRPTPTKEET